MTPMLQNLDNVWEFQSCLAHAFITVYSEYFNGVHDSHIIALLLLHFVQII